MSQNYQSPGTSGWFAVKMNIKVVFVSFKQQKKYTTAIIQNMDRQTRTICDVCHELYCVDIAFSQSRHPSGNTSALSAQKERKNCNKLYLSRCRRNLGFQGFIQ